MAKSLRKSSGRFRDSPNERQIREDSGILGEDYDDTRSKVISYLYHSYLVIVFGYSLYFSHFDESGKGFNETLAPPLRGFGPAKFLTYNCLVIHFVSACLHILSQNYSRLKLPRDIVFTAFAFPLSCYVFCNFWGVYYSQGREVIYPVSLVSYYPIWFNQVSHTVILPTNIGLAYFTFHRHIDKGLMLSLSFLISYSTFISYIRVSTGLFPYQFMNQMCTAALFTYLGAMFFCYIGFYQLGYLLTNIFHPSKRSQIERIVQLM